MQNYVVIFRLILGNKSEKGSYLAEDRLLTGQDIVQLSYA